MPVLVTLVTAKNCIVDWRGFKMDYLIEQLDTKCVELRIAGNKDLADLLRAARNEILALRGLLATKKPEVLATDDFNYESLEGEQP